MVKLCSSVEWKVELPSVEPVYLVEISEQSMNDVT